MQMFWSFYYR